ncbi:hypothetical protein Ddc_11825 [Ditylenchus destructor]|nr:hypothetical protein Ddc_11825 [Ditylenchus destructor]
MFLMLCCASICFQALHGLNIHITGTVKVPEQGFSKNNQMIHLYRNTDIDKKSLNTDRQIVTSFELTENNSKFSLRDDNVRIAENKYYTIETSNHGLGLQFEALKITLE